ncbi:hypothetical protein [Jannaschia sp. 2305UL9-9]|uniref:alginate O-acetyltransferase AlgX-related protein n=1 Tax=Jannaschia sp. 2305UL9-9 TaxID=3121638 RepID=UPI00352899C0
MTPLARTAAIAALGLLTLPATAQEIPSAYGCHGLEQDADLATIEGRDGMFYRMASDMRMDRPFSDATVADMAALSRALASRGTTLIYAPIPTKSVSMPAWLPDRATDLGFDLEVATKVQTDILDRLNAAGVVTADLRAALLTAEPGRPTFFATDTHWNAYGADLGARAIAEVMRAQPVYDTLEKTRHETVETGTDNGVLVMRRILQRRCTETLPMPVTRTYETRVAQPGGPLDIGLGGDAPLDIGLGEDAPLDIGLGDDSPLDIGLGGEDIDLFGEAEARLPVAIVGTSFSDLATVNFPGFLAQHSDLEVVNYAITGGAQFGAITSYLTSDDYQNAPPTFLVWENPIYTNFAQVGDQPMRELIAAAGDTCTRQVPFTLDPNGQTLIADLDTDLTPGDTLFLDTDAPVTDAVAFHFWSAEDRIRTRSIRRGDRLRRTGRFYMPLTGLWPDGARQVEVTSTAKFGPTPTLFVCSLDAS